MIIDELNKALSERIESVMSKYFPDARRSGSRWSMGSFDGEQGNSCGVYRGHNGIFLATDNGETKSILYLIKHKLNISRDEVIAEAKKICGIHDIRPSFPKKKPRPRRIKHSACEGTKVGEYWNGRGIKDETLLDYKVRAISREGLPTVSKDAWNHHYSVFVFWDVDGEVVMYRWIGIKKNNEGKAEIGTTSVHPTLWGWNTVNPLHEEIIITEGYADAMSVKQMCPDKSVVSIHSGAEDLNWIDNCYDALQGFVKIYLCLDMDTVGQRASEKISKRLGMHRCYVVKLPVGYKDANEFLLSNEMDKPSMRSLLDNAETIKPEGLKPASEYKDGFLNEVNRFHKELEENDFMWPDFKFRWRSGEATAVIGYSGHGKSSWLYQSVMHEIAVNNKRVCFASYEIPAQQMIFNLTWMYLKRLPKDTDLDIVRDVFGENLWFIEADEESKVTWEILREEFNYAMHRYGCEMFVVDSFLFITKKGDAQDNDRVGKGIATWAKNSDTTVALVCHADEKKTGVSNIPEQGNIIGGQGVAAAMHNVVSIWRDKEKEKETAQRGFPDDAKADGKIYIPKQRNTGNTVYKEMWFSKKTRNFTLAFDEKNASVEF